MVIIILLVICILIIIGYPILCFVGIIYGIQNKYKNDEQMFSKGSQLPPISGEEDKADLQ